jgi:hypothetical protein
VLRQLRDGADAGRDVLRRDQGAHHQHHGRSVREAEVRADAGPGREAREVDAVGDQGGAPARAVALLVQRVHADEAVAAEEAVLAPLAVRGPVAVLRHEDVPRPAAPPARAQQPVEEGVAAGEGQVEVARRVRAAQVPRDRELLPRALVAEHRPARPALEALARCAGHLHVAVGAAGAFGTRAEDGHLGVAALREQVGDALERDLRAAVDAVESR